MKKQYISPNIKIANIELAALMVNSPDPNSIPIVPESVTPDQAESKRHGLIVIDDEEFLME